VANLIAVDVAILLPTDVSQRAVALNAELHAQNDDDLRLDADHLPHVTLTQQFIREDEIELTMEQIDGVLAQQPPFRVIATGTAQSGHTVWIGIERTQEIIDLHERLMEALRGVERPGGTPAAFVDGAGRLADVVWVAGFRLKSSFGQFQPHITLGHGAEPPALEPFAFDATTVAACHLGRFCTCRRVLRAWSLDVR